jgi:cytoskeletal protein CcmA (bactofilin family)
MELTKAIMRFSLRWGTVLTVLLTVGLSSVQALTFGSGDKVQYSSLHRVSGDLVAAASTFTNEGIIDGDLLVSGYRVTNSGEVSGSIIASAYEFAHRGKVGGSIRTFGYHSEIDGFVERSVMAFGGEVVVTSRATIRRDLFARGGMLTVGGKVLGNVDLAGETIELSGQIDGDVKLDGKTITILPPAVIGGDLTYNVGAELHIDSLGGVTVFGETIALEPDESSQSDSDTIVTGLILFLAELLGAFVFGAILMALFRRQTEEAGRQMGQRFSVAAATGFLTMVVGLVSVLALIGSILAALIGFSMVSGDSAAIGAMLVVLATIAIPITSFAGVSGGILFYSGSIVMAAGIGYWIARVFRPDTSRLNRTHLLIGLALLFAVFELPYVGTVAFILCSMLGAGSIVLGIRHCHHDAVTIEIDPPPDDTPSSPAAKS